jgi:hypothetical protein
MGANVALAGQAAANPDRAASHWAFQPVANPCLPQTHNPDWSRTSIDPFILERLEARGLTPSPDADRRVLIRRATFDLIGLPPTPQEVEDFVADTSPAAFALVIDRLLASPRYGERWGRYWLDVARYADTKGYVFFQDKDYPWASTYRDYVIEAFNADLPYDRFLIEQIAADRLPLGVGAERRALRALGFLTLGGRFMNNPHDVIDDQIDVVTRGLLGLTVTCARCHDHKFDPIPTRDYYSLYGVFASSVEPTVPPLFEAPPRTDAYVAFENELNVRERRLLDFVKQKHRELIRQSKGRAAEYLLAAQAAQGQPSTQDFMLIADGSDLNPAMLLRWQVYLARTLKRRDPVFVPWHTLASLPEAEFAARADALCRGWTSMRDPANPIHPLVALTFAARPPRSLAEAAQMYAFLFRGAEAVSVVATAWAIGHGIAPPSLGAIEPLRQVFHGPDAPQNVPMSLVGDLALLPDRPSQTKLKELRAAVEKWRATGPGAPARAMALEDAPLPVEPRIFIRGNPNNLGAPVPRQFLAVLAGSGRRPFGAGSGRLELARAIVDPGNPLTARVLINRIWMHHFGTPLVGTPGDFGLQSERPPHPDLLDHLASAFVEDGWSIKRLHRRIMLSRTYQQASNDRPHGRSVDPENALFWRMNRRRLDFEATRDSLLAVSGRLSQTVGGPSIKAINSATATERTLYGFIDRQDLPSLYRTFDFPDPCATSARRDTTTVAPQALYMMNHPFVLAAARDVLKRPEVDHQRNTELRIDRLYRLIYGRPPTGDEVRLAKDYLGKDPQPVTLWQRYVQALMLANEFVYVD